MNEISKLNIESIKLLEKYKLLIPLIKKIILGDCVKDIVIEEEIMEKLRNNVIEQQKREKQDFQSFLSSTGQTEIEFWNVHTLPRKINKYCMKEFGHKTKSRFLNQKDKLDSVVYSLVRVEDLNLAKELYHQITEGESLFEDIAKIHSVGPERHTRGIVGPISLEKGHPKINELLRVSRVGEINEPIKINQVFAVTRLEHLDEAKLNEDMELQLANDIFEEWLDKEAALVCSNLKK